MSSGAGKSGKQPSWRDAAAGGPSRTRGASSWRTPGASDGRSPLGEGRKRVAWGQILRAGGAAAAALLCAGIFWWATTLPGCTKTQIIVTGVTEYAACAIAPNTFGENDANALLEFHDGNRLIVDSLQGRPKFAERFQTVKSDRSLVVYLSVHGGAGREGAYLLPSDANPDDVTSFLSLDLLWNALAAQPPGQKKLVLLDLCRTRTNWRTGLLDNFVQDDLEPAVRDIPNLFVMCSCSPGELSWASRDLGPDGQGQSVFGHFVATGLRGAADTDGDHRIFVQELFDYVFRNTVSWVEENRDPAGQHPILIPAPQTPDADARDFKIVAGSFPGERQANSASGDETSGEKAAGDDASSRNRQQQQAAEARSIELWKRRNALAADFETAPYHFDPLRWRIATQLLLRADEWLLAREVEQADATLTRVERLLETLERSADPDAFAEFRDRPFVYFNIGRRVLGRPPEPADADPAVDIPPFTTPEAHLEAVCRELPRRTADAAAAAVDVRRLAEAAASGPLGTFAAMRNRIVEADQLRREGEDLLFVADRPGGTEKLDAARAGYVEAQNISRKLHFIRNVRNQLSAELPELAYWAARRAPAENSLHREKVLTEFRRALADHQIPAPSVLEQHRPLNRTSEDILGAVEVDLLILFALARDIEDGLARVTTVNAAADLASLETQASNAQTLLFQIQERLENHAANLRKTTQPQPRSWRQIRDVLRCPFLNADARGQLRSLLVTYSRQMMTRSLDERAREVKVAPAARPPIDGTMWNALWIVQTLSLGGQETIATDQLWDSWWSVWRADDKGQASGLAQLGELIRRAWLTKRNAVLELTGAETADLETARSNLMKADRIARCLYSCDAEAIVARANPTEALRKFHATELLLAHCRRYLEDFWAGWYAEAARACLASSREIAQPAFETTMAELEELLEQRQQAQLHVRSGQVSFGTSYEAQAELNVARFGAVPAGTAAVWLDLPQGAPVTLTDATRRPFATDGSEQTLAFSFSKPLEFSEERCPLVIDAQPRVFFRGHRWTDRIEPVRINPCRPTGVRLAYTAPVPEVGQVIVLGDDQRPIMFVFDCSYSMTAPMGGGTRFQAALQTLQQTINALAGLQANGNPQQVGLIAYGHRVQKLTTTPNPVVNPNWPFAVPAAVANNPMLDIEVLNGLAQLNPQALTASLANLGVAGPWGNTPLLAAIDLACRHLNDKGSGGMVVAITDGEYKDPERVQRELQTRLRNMKQNGLPVDLHIVAFDVQANDRATLERFARENNGRFYDAPTPQRLAAALQQAITPRPYQIAARGQRGQWTHQLGTPSGKLAPGHYTVGVGDLAPLEFEIVGGEKLVFELRAGGVHHFAPRNIKLDRESDVAGLKLGYRSLQENRADQSATVTLSLFDNSTRDIVQRPAEIHFEVRPLVDPEPRRRPMEWRLSLWESVPTWEVSVSDWPSGSGAEVRAYWKNVRTRPDGVFAWLQAEAGHEFDVPLSEGRRLPLKFQRAHYDRSRGVVELGLVAADREENPPRSTQFYDHLANLRVRIAAGRQGPPRDLAVSSEFIESDEQLILTFDVPRDFDPDSSWIQVTSWASRLDGAVKLLRPLEIPRPD